MKGNLETPVGEGERVATPAEGGMGGLSEGMWKQLHDGIGNVVRKKFESKSSEGRTSRISKRCVQIKPREWKSPRCKGERGERSTRGGTCK